MKNSLSERDYQSLIAPLYRFDRSFWLTSGLLALLAAPGLALYVRQLVLGLGVTALNRPAFWGIYLVNFIFLIGVSMAGTVISAVLQLLGVNWRRPITRIAESLTVFGLMIAGLQILMDMGRPDRFLFTLIYGRFQAPLMWDIMSLTLYLLTAIFALYLQLLPDIALLRDTAPQSAPAWRKKLYSLLALNWRGNAAQWHQLEKTMTTISVIIVPIGVSLHTVTSWLFSTTTQPGWKSTILGPYFVVGAIFSGMGLLFAAAAYARRAWKLEEYIKEEFFLNLGWLFIVMSAVWFYFTLNETLIITAEQEAMEFPVMAAKLFGEFSAAFWGMVLLMIAATWVMVAPKFVSGKPGPLARLTGSAWLKAHPIETSVLAGLFVLVGMWLERWNILMPTLTHARLIPYDIYIPTFTEIAITISLFALLALMFVVFFKFFPPVSVWEVREGRVVEAAQPKAVMPLPEVNGEA